MRSDRSTRLRRQALLLRSRRRRQASLLPAIVIAGLTLAGLAVTLALAAVAGTYSLYARDYVPVASQLEGQRGQLTAIFDRYGPADGSFLGFLSNPSGAETYAISLDAVSPWMVAATVSTEDQQFWDHNGVNIRGTGRAVIALANGETEVGGGGSSITQQLVKNLYLTTDCTLVDGVRACVAPRTLDRKAREMVYAFELERELTKEQILELYLNSVSYADRYVGIEAAAQGYFRKPAAELTIAEAALLAGVPSSPGRYHPRASCVTDEAGACLIDPEGRTLLGGAAKERQADVLSLMVQHGAITAIEAEEAVAQPLAIWPLEQSSRADAWIENQVEPRLERMCIAGLLPLESGAASCLDSIRTAGYRVTTSLDQPLTNVARDVARTSIAEGLDNGCNCHNASIVTIDPTSGQILVYVENVDPTSSVPQVSGNIDQATEINQPGSSMKPIIYLAWMDILGRAPMHSFWDTNPLTLENPNDRNSPTPVPADPEEQPFEVTNSRPRGGTTDGLQTLKSALGGSQNVAAFRAASEVGVDNVIAMAKRLGMTTLHQGFDPTFWDHQRVQYGPAIATGGANVRVVDMAYVDATFANMGTMVGVPTLAQEIDPAELLDLVSTEDEQSVLEQKRAFQRGMLRLPGTRELDPIVVLRVEDRDGRLLFEQGAPETREAVNAGSAWLLYTVMSDCTARAIIWNCGSSNEDLALDFFLGETKIPGGVKTGTQQGFTDSNDTLETWITSFTRYSGTAIWVGNADNSLVNDGRPGNFASANTTLRMMKRWMGAYHSVLHDRQLFLSVPGFDELRPPNVTFGPMLSATTEGGRRGGCTQKVDGWFRTDIDYGLGDCELVTVDTRNGRVAGDDTPSWARREAIVVRTPALRPDLVARLARQFGLPIVSAYRVYTGGSPAAPPPATEVATPVATPATVAPVTPTVAPRVETPVPTPVVPTVGPVGPQPEPEGTPVAVVPAS